MKRKPYLVYSYGDEICIECGKEIKRHDTVFLTPAWVGEICIDCFDNFKEKYQLSYEILEKIGEEGEYCAYCGVELDPENETCVIWEGDAYHIECGFPEMIA